MATISQLIELARVRAVLDVRCQLAGSTVMGRPGVRRGRGRLSLPARGRVHARGGRQVLSLSCCRPAHPLGIRNAGASPTRDSTKAPDTSFATIRTTETCIDGLIDLFRGHYTFGPPAGVSLLQSLSDPMVVSFTAEDDEVRTMRDLMRRDAHADGPGTTAILSSICAALLTMVLRQSATKLTATVLWTAVNDHRIARVIEALLQDPGTTWLIGKLAA